MTYFLLYFKMSYSIMLFFGTFYLHTFEDIGSNPPCHAHDMNNWTLVKIILTLNLIQTETAVFILLKTC